MRPTLVEFLNRSFDTTIFSWLTPYPAAVYALAMTAGLLVFVHRSKKAELSQYHALGAALWAMAGGLLGARLFFLGMHPEQFLDQPAMLFQLSGGTASWGAYLGGTAGLLGYFFFHRQSSLPYLDVLGVTLGLGPFIGRWSCFLNGDDFGTLSQAAWAVQYPHGSIPFVYQVQQGLISPLSDFSLPVHPVQLYLSLNGLIIFLLLSFLWKRLRLAPGMFFLLYWVIYSFNRYFLEFFRGGVPRDILGYFSPSQVMTLLIMLAALLLMLYRHAKTLNVNKTGWSVPRSAWWR